MLNFQLSNSTISIACYYAFCISCGVFNINNNNNNIIFILSEHDHVIHMLLQTREVAWKAVTLQSTVLSDSRSRCCGPLFNQHRAYYHNYDELLSAVV